VWFGPIEYRISYYNIIFFQAMYIKMFILCYFFCFGDGPIMPINMEGTRPKPYRIGGHPAPTGPALPNLINAVSILKIKVKVKTNAVLAGA
jgi:hypothetical protein